MSAIFRKLARAAGRVQQRGLNDMARSMREVLAASASTPVGGKPVARSSDVPSPTEEASNRTASSPWPGLRFGAGSPLAWPVDADVALAPRPETSAAVPSIGRFDEDRFTGPAGTRAFKLFEPAGFEERALPLVVMLHGCTQNADDFAVGTRMNRLAQEQGFYVLYPQQAPRSNANKCWNWFVPGDQRRGSGEPALLASLTQQVIATHRVDADRVYVAGLSAGGAMAAILAREYPDIYAAAGVHSGLQAGAAHDVGSAFAAMRSGTTLPTPAWSGSPSPAHGSQPYDPSAPANATAERGAPLIVFHGDADATVSALNGAHVVDSALGDASWAAERHIDPARPDRRSSTRIVYHSADATSADAPSRAEHWVVHGAAHAWSGGDASGSFTDQRGPDASREMLRFFAEHPRLRAPAGS